MNEKITDNDKWCHCAVCAAIAFIDPIAAVTAALAKEYGDSKATGNHWCWLDVAADAIGTLIGTASRYFFFRQLIGF